MASLLRIVIKFWHRGRLHLWAFLGLWSFARKKYVRIQWCSGGASWCPSRVINLLILITSMALVNFMVGVLVISSFLLWTTVCLVQNPPLRKTFDFSFGSQNLACLRVQTFLPDCLKTEMAWRSYQFPCQVFQLLGIKMHWELNQMQTILAQTTMNTNAQMLFCYAWTYCWWTMVPWTWCRSPLCPAFFW